MKLAGSRLKTSPDFNLNPNIPNKKVYATTGTEFYFALIVQARGSQNAFYSVLKFKFTSKVEPLKPEQVGNLIASHGLSTDAAHVLKYKRLGERESAEPTKYLRERARAAMAIKSYKFRIYPSKRQTQTLTDQLAICAELYNAALQERRDAYGLERKSISRFDQIYQLPEIRANRADVGAINANVLEDVITRVDKAFKAFFRRCKLRKKLLAMGVKDIPKPGYPRFRSFRRYDSMTFRQIGNVLSGNKLRVSKIGQVRINLHRPIEGKIKTVTIKQEAGRWFAVFVCEADLPCFLPFSPNTIGVDVGLTSFAVLSTGEAINNPRHYRHAERSLRVAQRCVARRQKGSKRRRKAVALLQRIHAHVRAQRADFHHNLSRRLVNENGLIAVEDLNVKGLARTRLAKSIHDAGWSSFIDKLTYKAEDAGRVLIKVDPRGTSQTCICGTEVRKTLKERWHLCLSCGLSLPRDHISAQVILFRAQAGPSGVNVGAVMPCVA